MDNGKSSGENAYERILAAIESRELEPGSRLRETELAKRLGLSRTPVREALKQLEAEGVVEHRPHQGAVVAQLDHTAVVELYFLREILEGAAARLAAIHATDAEIELLQSMIDVDRTLLDQPQELQRRNKLFHQRLYRTSRNRFLIRALDNLRITLALGTSIEAKTSGGAAAIDSHAELVAAIAAHKPSLAEEMARDHVRGAFKVRLEQTSF
jgi:DNA-binding GntR family transcriptional regulator